MSLLFICRDYKNNYSFNPGKYHHKCFSNFCEEDHAPKTWLAAHQIENPAYEAIW